MTESKKMSDEDIELLRSLREDFFANAFLELEEWESNLLDYETSESCENMQDLRRLIHSMKGSAAAIGFVEATEILHNLEEWLLAAENSAKRSSIVSVGLEFVDKWKVYLRALSKGVDASSAARVVRALLG